MVVQNLYRTQIFVDTGAFIALAWEKDRYHEKAIFFYRTNKKRLRLITSSFIISETFTWLRYHTHAEISLTFLGLTSDLEIRNRLIIVRPSPDLEFKASNILYRHRDMPLSYADGVTGAIIQELGLSQVFGFDKHLSLFGATLLPCVE